MATSNVWSLPNQWLCEEVGFHPNVSLGVAQVERWIEEKKDELPPELLKRDRAKLVAYIVKTHHNLKRQAREKEAEEAVHVMAREATNHSSDDEPLVKRATTDKPKKRRRESSQNTSLEAIRSWLGARIERDPSPLSRAEIETWLTQNRSRLPEDFLSKELFQQRQYCYDIFAKNGGMRRRKEKSLGSARGASKRPGPSDGPVGHNSDGGAGPSEAHPSVQASGDDAREPDFKKQKKGIDSSLNARDQERERVANGVENQPYVEWLFKGTSSGNFKFKGDSACPPPKSADFTLALKKHTEQLAAIVASLKGWTLKLVRKGCVKEGDVGYVARYRYKKRDFMARLEKVEEFLKLHPNLRKGAASRNDIQNAVERKGKKAEPPALQQVVKAAEGPPKERPRSGKKDVLGDFLHTWTLLTDLEMRLEEQINRAERIKGPASWPSFSDALEASGRKQTQWQYSEALPDGRDAAKECPQALDRNGAHLLHKREAGLHNGPGREWSQHIAGGGRPWMSLARGWNSRARAWQGVASSVLRAEFSAWRPTSYAWTSHALTQAVAPPQELQGGQKVLDIRLHPKGAPYLVAGCNISPNELILYDLRTGQAKSLQGHNSFIQAVEFTSTGDRIVSCGKDTLRVWESTTGREIHSIGPDSGAGGELEVTGHSGKIGCMTTNPYRPEIAVTSGTKDKRLLLWNVERGQLATDLNRDLRLDNAGTPAVDTMVFASESTLLCGEDAEERTPAMVSLWDIEQQKRLATLPAHDKYVVCCQVSSSRDTFITGAGDGCAALWDVREKSAQGIVRIRVGNDCEVTSVSFSPCDVYFQASSTTNRTLVFDRRYMSLERRAGQQGLRPMVEQSCAALRYRPLHCLSHGEPMPTRTEELREQAGVLAGYVDDGDQGVNHAQWFHHGTNLVTASGNGSVTIWDVSLGVPCLKTFEKAHAGSCNAVAVSLDDRTICSGGDDQKLTLYQDTRNGSHPWRLTALSHA